MSYNINYKLCFAAVALILASTPSQKALAVLPLDAEKNNSMVVPSIPDEISLQENSDENTLLTPPELSGKDKEEDAIPLDSSVNDVPLQNLDLTNSQETNQAVVSLDPVSNISSSDSSASGSVQTTEQPIKADEKKGVTNTSENKADASKFQQLQIMKQQATTPESNNFGEAILSQVDNDLFNQMSDLEKQTSLLSLELRREKVKNEIEALKAARQKSIDEANAKKEEKERKKLEWEHEQQRKLLIEEQKLRALNLAYEKLRQENVIKAYKEEMLAKNQDWIANNVKLYDESAKLDDNRNKLVNDLKLKLNYLLQLSAQASEAAETAKKNYNRELSNLQTQISILKSRLEAEKLAREDAALASKDKTNPFASLSEKDKEKKNQSQKLSDEYAIMEIRGQGGDLSAKLINKNGSSFLVQKGTVLQTGHTVDEITQTYITATKNGKKEYLYFAAGGILEREPKAVSPLSPIGLTPLPKKSGELEPLPSLSASQGLPSLRSGMFVR